MLGRVMNTSLYIFAFRLKYFPVEGAFNDCDTVKLKNKRTDKGYMSMMTSAAYLGHIVLT